MLVSHSIIALIPARAGSQRIPGKNIKPLAGHPLLAYTIAAAKESGIFSYIVVSSSDNTTRAIARQYGAQAIDRPEAYSSDNSPDIEWVHHALVETKRFLDIDCFAILRPTSPFRTAATIRRAWEEFDRSGCDSLRAVQTVSVNPYKMWVMEHCELRPLMPTYDVPPWHSRPTQTLPHFVQQNASLEMAHCSLVRDRLYPSITGTRIWGFPNPEPEGFDLNTPEDWERAERMIAEGRWTLPTVSLPPAASSATA